MPPFLQSIDTIHWGRKTYEQALAFGGVDAIPTVVRLYYAIPARR